MLRTSVTVGVVAAALAAPSEAPAAEATPEQRELLVGLIRHYRALTWHFEQTARVPRTRAGHAERRTNDAGYLQWMVDRWRLRSHRAHRQALRRLEQTHGVRPPKPVGRYASIVARIRYFRSLAWHLEHAHPELRRSPSSGAFRRVGDAGYRRWALQLWQNRAARAARRLAQLPPHRVLLTSLEPRWLVRAFLCIQRHEGAWNDPHPPYWGGLQMDRAFMRTYGPDFHRRWGTADRWPPWAQITAAIRAHQSGRGFTPWPNTRRACRV